MFYIIKKNWEKNRYLLLAGLFITLFFLITVVFKNDSQVVKKSENLYIYNSSDIDSLKKFLFSQIRSPFINLNYEIKKGDTIQKILKKFKVSNSDIANTINQYKKFGNPNQLLIGNTIDIIIKKSFSGEKNSIVKFSVPVTKSSTIRIVKDEENKLIFSFSEL